LDDCTLGIRDSMLLMLLMLLSRERQAQIDRSFIAIDNSRPCTARTRRLPLIHSQCFNSRNRRRHSANVFPMQRLPGPQPHLRGPRPPPPPESVSRACLSDASVDLSQCRPRFFDTGSWDHRTAPDPTACTLCNQLEEEAGGCDAERIQPVLSWNIASP
jgi:hypothetical protein